MPSQQIHARPANLIALTISLSLILLSSATGDGNMQQADLKQLAQGNNQFAWDLYRQLLSKPGNVFVSPYSISAALAMTATGARGDTADQMKKVLRLDDNTAHFAAQFEQLQASLLDKPKGYELHIANALWGQNAHPFKPEFIANLQKHFRAQARVMDFASDPEPSRQTINRWVEEQTKQKIRDLLPGGSIGPLTKLVLTNAIYFKGKWAAPFKKEATKPADFFVSTNTPVKADMMYHPGSYRYAETPNAQALEMPYEGNRLSMLILLPKQKDGLAALEKDLNSGLLDKFLKEQHFANANVHVPKFKTTFGVSLKDTLPQMGMPDAFDSSKADFSGIDGTKELQISDVLHKAFCEVNEEGTEAAGATAVVARPASAIINQPPPIEFNADHPFIFLIRDTQTGSILFLGRMSDPTK